MRNKISVILFSGLVIWLHYYIYSCVNCSKIFVWWNDLVPSVDLKLTPILFSILILTFGIIVLLNWGLKLKGALKFLILMICIVNIVYWIYVLIVLKFAFYIQYLICIVIHIAYIFTIKKV